MLYTYALLYIDRMHQFSALDPDGILSFLCAYLYRSIFCLQITDRSLSFNQDLCLSFARIHDNVQPFSCSFNAPILVLKTHADYIICSKIKLGFFDVLRESKQNAIKLRDVVDLGALIDYGID